MSEPGLHYPALPPQRLIDGTMEQVPGGGAHAGGPADPDAGGRTEPSSSLASLRDELTAELAPQERDWANPNRPAYGARFRLDLTEADFELARKFATRRKGRRPGEEDDVSEVVQLQHLLARYNTAILKDGAVLLDEATGRPATFRSPDFQSIYGSSRAIDAVRGFYATDGAIIQVGRAFSRATGWMDEPDEVDLEEGPTQR